MQEVPELTPELLQANPALLVAILLVMLLAFGVFVCSLSAWIFLIYRRSNQLTILPVAPWTPRAWGLVDLALVGIAVVVAQNLAVLFAANVFGVDLGGGEEQEGTLPLSLIALVGAANLAVMVGSVAWISLRYGTSPPHSGFTMAKMRRNLAVGLIGGFASLPIVYCLMIVVNSLFSKEYDHPLISEMIKNATVSSYLMGAFAAVIVAPLTEEFLFRVLLQGWLQSLPFRSVGMNLLGGYAASKQTGEELSQGGAGESAVVVSEQTTEQSAWSDSREPFAAVGDPFRPPQLALPHELKQGIARDGEFVPPLWPSIVSGTLFGLAHYEYGLSFIPLIVLGVILGLMYRATHSIWPSLCVHFMLNSISMLMLGFVLLLSNAAAKSDGSEKSELNDSQRETASEVSSNDQATVGE